MAPTCYTIGLNTVFVLRVPAIPYLRITTVKLSPKHVISYVPHRTFNHGAAHRIRSRWQLAPCLQVLTQSNRRNLSIHGALVPPLVFISLLVILWTYKCLMMIIFQNKIIYMPGFPPFSRSEMIADYVRECGPVRWREETIIASDRTRLSLAVGGIDITEEEMASDKKVIVVYFQGNAASLPSRLPSLSQVLREFEAKKGKTSCEVVALSYRGYWTSRGRPSQRGIEKDAYAALTWIGERHQNSVRPVNVVLWGQSIESGVAATALSQYLQFQKNHNPAVLRITGLVLETPFLSIRHLLTTLYPQIWLPYRYLWPFLRSNWDSKSALSMIVSNKKHVISGTN